MTGWKKKGKTTKEELKIVDDFINEFLTTIIKNKIPFKEIRKHFMRAIINAALIKTQGNKVQAAKYLSINKTSLVDNIKSLQEDKLHVISPVKTRFSRRALKKFGIESVREI